MTTQGQGEMVKKTAIRMFVFQGLPMLVGSYVGWQLAFVVQDAVRIIGPNFSQLGIAGAILFVVGIGLLVRVTVKGQLSLVPAIFRMISTGLVVFGGSLVLFVFAVSSTFVRP